MYRSPNPNVNIFFDKLDLTLDKSKNTKKSIVIAGDLNIDILCDNNVTKKMLRESYNIKCHINKPTRRNKCIDHIASTLDEVSSAV